jgi:predicted molibdopterin-dependent oxidoreductase YjgC
VMFWTGPQTERSPSLRFLSTPARAEISVEDAHRARLSTGDDVRISAGGNSVEAMVVVRTGVPTGSVFLIGLTVPDDAVDIAPAGRRTEVIA